MLDDDGDGGDGDGDGGDGSDGVIHKMQHPSRVEKLIILTIETF